VPTKHYETYHPTDWTPPNKSWASSDAIRRTMLKNRNRDTRPELAVRSAAHGLGLRYLVARRPIREVRRSADMVFPRARVAVFVDGCWWHGCPEHYVAPATNVHYWSSKIGGNRRRDADTDARLEAAGWLVVRAWEHEDPAQVAVRILEVVRPQASRSSSPSAV
jgi:DNA mismatch endonuclease, patch repair protein